MTLEEFVTLLDDKDGLTTPSRVEELITLLQKEKDDTVKSVDEAATRQHTVIARAIVETKSMHCLDHFVKLGGLSYINKWLNDALKSSDDDTSCDFIEESIASQCRALEKLDLSNEILISSGILDTVNNLCDCNSAIIKDKARQLLHRWKDVDFSLVPMDVEKVDAVGDVVEDKSISKTDEDGPLLDVIDVGFEQTETSQNFVEVRKEEDPDLEGLTCLELVESEDIKVESTCSQMTDPVSFGQLNMDGGAIGVISNTKVDVPAAVCHSSVVTPVDGNLNIDNSNSLDTRHDIGDGQTGDLENTTGGKVTEMIDLDIVKYTMSSNLQESESCSSVADITEKTMPELETQTNVGCEEDPIPTRDDFVDVAKIFPSEHSSGMDDAGRQRLLVEGKPDRTSPPLEALPTKAASVVAVGLNSRSDEDYAKVSAIQNLARDTRGSALADTRSDIDLDYGLMDALEVARQVAKSVKMEMVNDGSYENNSVGSRQPGSPGSTNEIDSKSRTSSEDSSSKLDSSPREPEECMQGVDQPVSLAQEDQINTNVYTCEFDLNEEVACENAEFSVNLNCNMAEENGSGVFHHLSAHRDGDPSGALPLVPSDISGKHKQDSFSIDLNLDREENESNVAVAPAKSEMLDFDLNMMSDAEDVPPSSSRSFDKHNFSHLNGHTNSSPASSLFPMQPTINIDLSEGPAMQSMSSRSHPYLIGTSFSQNGNVHPLFGTSTPQNVSVQKDAIPSISIMGARVEVNKNNFPHGAPSFSNGISENHSFEVNIGAMGSYLSVGSMGSYGHPSPFAYSNTNAIPMFRPGNTMTYMVDPRAGPLPQMVNPPSVVPHMYAQRPFFMNLTGPPQSLKGVLPSRPNFDLNLGYMNDGGNRQDMATRQLLSNNQGRFLGEQIISPDLQPSSSSGKRKELETRWETYPYNIKRRYPP